MTELWPTATATALHNRNLLELIEVHSSPVDLRGGRRRLLELQGTQPEVTRAI